MEIHVRRLALFLFPAMLLVACGNATQPTPVLGVVSTPGKVLATVYLSPTPVPSPQAPAEPTLTPAPTRPLPTLPAQQPTLPIGTVGPLQELESDDAQATGTPGAVGNCATSPPEPFAGPWQSNPAAQEELGCPIGLPQQRLAAYQPFEHGFMIWVEAEDSIYVLANTAVQQGQATDTWWKLEDTFVESDPTRDDSLVAPPGLIQPERGFGKVWRANGFVREAVGWANAPEQGYDALWLNFERGWMLTSPSTEPVFAFVPSGDSGANTGVHLGPQTSTP